MKLTFYGAAKMVTGSNYLLESGGEKILIDCGLRQGSNYSERQNFEPFPYNPKEISAVVVTHPHIDHTGRLPKLYKDGFRGRVYSTIPAKDFSKILLLDSEHVLMQDADKFKLPFLYGIREVEELIGGHWEGVEYHTPIKIGSRGQFNVTFYSAGHVLGSSFVLIEAEGKRLVFSGDLGNSPAPIIGKREEMPDDVDYCLIDSTYGGRVHEPAAERKEVLEDMIEDTVKAGGVLMIPAFAMERTQDLLYELNELVEHGRVPRVPVFIDSPLAIKLTEVYKQYYQYFDAETKKIIKSGDAIFNFPGLKMTMTTEESKTINDVPPPKVIIAGAGMSNAGRILHHERRYLPDPKSTLLIVGYQAAGSLGRKLLDGKKLGKPFDVKMFGENIPVRANVKAIGAWSAHADQPQLLGWLKPARERLKKVFLVHGEIEEMTPLSQIIRDDLAVSVEIPAEGGGYDL